MPIDLTYFLKAQFQNTKTPNPVNSTPLVWPIEKQNLNE